MLPLSDTRWGGTSHDPMSVWPHLHSSTLTQKRIDDALLHVAGIEEVPYWELAELPDQVVGGILSRVGLSDRMGGGAPPVEGDPTAEMRGALGSPQRGGGHGGGRGRKGLLATISGSTVTSNTIILEAFLKMSDAAQLHNLQGRGGGAVDMAAAASATRQKRAMMAESSCRQR